MDKNERKVKKEIKELKYTINKLENQLESIVNLKLTVEETEFGTRYALQRGEYDDCILIFNRNCDEYVSKEDLIKMLKLLKR